MQNQTLTILLLLLLSNTLIAQEKLKVAGDARIDGVLKLIKGDDNTVIGLNAGTALTTGSDNAFLGEKAGEATTTGADNVFLGNDAGRTNVGGSSNVFVGGDAGQDNTTGSHNIYVGNASGQSGSTATDNTFVGDSTGYANTASGNTFMGSGAGKNSTTAQYNTLIGTRAGSAITTNGENVMIGYEAGINTVGSGGFNGTENVFIGPFAGQANTSGYGNTYIGRRAGRDNSTGIWNTFVGKEAGSSASGDDNSFFGESAGSSASGNSNSFFGTSAGLGLNIGNNNSFFGRSAGSGLATGNNNVLIGENAEILSLNDFDLATGNNNTFVGQFAKGIGNNNTLLGRNTLAGILAETNTAVTNSTAIGYEAEVGVSNKVRIGNGNVTSIEGQVNFVGVSDKRFKKNIQDSPLGLEFIQKLRPVTYEFKEGHEGITYTGFIAQEVEEAVQEMKLEFSGVVPPAHERDHYGLRYAEFTVPLVKATQEQQELIEDLETEVSDQNRKITQLERDNRQLRDELAEIKALLGRVVDAEGQSAADQTIQLGNARLLQNSPNPFSEATYIDYFIPEGTGQAEIRITDMSGRVLKSETIAKGGEGRLQLQAQSLPAGTYAYTLLVDGRMVETKQMVLTK